SLVPTTPLGRAFTDALGSTNRAVAEVCDSVVLVVAGQPVWLRSGGAGRPATVPAQPGPARSDGGPAGTVPADDVIATDSPSPEVITPSVPTAANGVPARPDAWTAPTMMLPMVATGLVIQPGMELPMPDDHAGPQALDRLATLDVAGAGLGNLERVVGFAAATQSSAVPAPWRNVRVLLVHGDHDGGAAAGSVPGESSRRAEQARSGAGALALLAAEAGASLQVVAAPPGAPMEDGPALTAAAVETALRYGWRLAEEAADSGVQLLVLGACGAGSEAAAAAVLAATAGAEPAAVLGRVVTAGGQVDDLAWMTRCATVRDAMRRIRHTFPNAKELLAEVGGGDIAIATGILLGATARRIPVLLDGPVGVAAALVSRDLAGQARHWCLLPDHGGHPAVRLGADVLGLTPLFDLRLDLGEGANALAVLPLLRSASTIAGTLPVHPTVATRPDRPDDGTDTGDDEEPAGDTDDGEFAEPEPAGPGPATSDAPDGTRTGAPHGD
ncbi:MAG TPA: bifunctional adenosylcobinamide kinase/adenosylcobinamide-phosphate guanylyltransferase, partial [Micromonospora sp.]